MTEENEELQTREVEQDGMRIVYRTDRVPVESGYLIPARFWEGYWQPYTRLERGRNWVLGLLRLPVPKQRWVPGLKEMMGGRHD